MHILINNKELDFELENEKSVWEIYNEVQKWVSSDGKVITAINIDDNMLGINEDLLKKHSLENVDKIIFEVSELDVLIKDSLQESIAYLDRLKIGLAQLPLEEFSHVNEGLKWLVEVITRSKQIMPLNFQNIKDFDERIKILGKIGAIKNPVPEDIGLLDNEINFWKESISTVINNYENSVSGGDYIKKIKALAEKVSVINQSIEDLIIQLQTGNDAQAMDNLKHVGDFLNNVVILLKDIALDFKLNFSDIYIEEAPVQDIIEQLTKLLNEIASVMEEEDIVILCDLLSYRLIPHMEKIKQILDHVESVVADKPH